MFEKAGGDSDCSWKFIGSNVNVVDITNPSSYVMPKLDEITSSKEFWFDKEKQLNIEVIANVIAFTTQVMHHPLMRPS